MRGSDERSGSLFSYVDLEARVRVDHPLRVIRDLANAALGDLSGEFGKLYTDFGRPSIAPEKLLRAMLLQAFYGVRSERHLMERMEFDLLFRWFVGRDCGQVPERAFGAAEGQAPAIERSLLGGWHAD
jgi:transposase